ncbi:hypothetical protein [Streptomyces europaeiscabiei]
MANSLLSVLAGGLLALSAPAAHAAHAAHAAGSLYVATKRPAP